MYKSTQELIIMCVLLLSLLVMPTAWPDTRFKMDPEKVAAAETRMWQAYYSNDYVALSEELTNLLRNQFGFSISDANYIGDPLASAAMRFESAESNYKFIVLPDLERAYSRLRQKLDISFDPKETAKAELDWWVARRTPGRDSAEEVGRLITRLYVLLFGEENTAFGRAGLLRAQAAHIRDEGGAQCDWDVVDQLLRKSYQALQEGLNLVPNNYSGQVVLNWDPNKENNIAGYRIYYGNSSGNYGSNVDAGNKTSFTITGLESGKTYYFVVTAYNTNGIESSYSAEVSLKATVGTKSPLLPQDHTEEHALQKGEESDAQKTDVVHKDPKLVWLAQAIDLTKDTIGPFTVKVRVEGVNKQRYPSIFPRIEYYIGARSSYGYFDMISEGDNVWRFDIPDPKWQKHRSESLHYHVKVFDEEGNVIIKDHWKKELIDSFIQQDN